MDSINIGDKVVIIDCSWAYVIINGIRDEHERSRFGRRNWIVLDMNLPLPTPPNDYNQKNNVILYKNGVIAYSQLRFLRHDPCPSCGRPYAN